MTSNISIINRIKLDVTTTLAHPPFLSKLSLPTDQLYGPTNDVNEGKKVNRKRKRDSDDEFRKSLNKKDSACTTLTQHSKYVFSWTFVV